jgi:Sporulation protein and related proteins
MAQWGAYGYAQQGYSYDDILAHYYKGTTIGQASVTKVRVYLAQGQSRLTVASPSPFSVRDGIGQLWHLAAGPQTFGPGLRIKTSDVPQGSSCPDRSRSTPARRPSGSATARTAARCRRPS